MFSEGWEFRDYDHGELDHRVDDAAQLKTMIILIESNLPAYRKEIKHRGMIGMLDAVRLFMTEHVTPSMLPVLAPGPGSECQGIGGDSRRAVL